MSDTQDQKQQAVEQMFNPLLNASVQQNANVVLTLDIITDSLQDAIRRLRPNVDITEFLTAPKKFEDGSCFALVNRLIPKANNSYHLLVLASSTDKNYNLVCYVNNGKLASDALFVNLSGEQVNEIIRQLVTMRDSGDKRFTVPGAYNLMYFKDEIPDFEYFSDEVPVQETNGNVIDLSKARTGAPEAVDVVDKTQNPKAEDNVTITDSVVGNGIADRHGKKESPSLQRVSSIRREKK